MLDGAKLDGADLRGAEISGLDLTRLGGYRGLKITQGQQHILLSGLGIEVEPG
jgi:fluoroquinolone resistance protein